MAVILSNKPVINALRILIRTDAALHIGTGHVMRCLTLANALKQKGATTLFICREHEGHLANYIKEQGHQCYLLPRPSQPVAKQPDPECEPPHAQWLGETWQNDVQQTKAALGSQHFDWLIVDHYALDYRWENAMRNLADNIMVIDDLADRKHDCNLLLDQTLGRNTNDYTSKVPEACTILTGAHYALLRPEFSQWREYSLARRQQAGFKSLLVNLGGIDNENITNEVLVALGDCPLPSDLRITVVIGLSSQHLSGLEVQAKRMPVLTQIVTNAANMAEIMANSDISIGAAGATSWERCCLGLPCLILCLADNQLKSIQELEKNKVVIPFDLKELKKYKAKALWPRLSQLIESSESITSAAKNVVDGFGVARVIEKFNSLNHAKNAEMTRGNNEG